MRLNIDDDRTVKELYGYFYLGKGNDQSTTLKLMFLRNVQLIRFHKPKPKAEDNPLTPAAPGNKLEGKPDTLPEIKHVNNNNDLKPKQL